MFNYIHIYLVLEVRDGLIETFNFNNRVEIEKKVFDNYFLEFRESLTSKFLFNTLYNLFSIITRNAKI